MSVSSIRYASLAWDEELFCKTNHSTITASDVRLRFYCSASTLHDCSFASCGEILHSPSVRTASDVEVATCWSEWSPCTVTCLGKGESAIFAKRWRIWRCESNGIRDCHSSLNDSVATCQPIAQFKLCADEIPLCVSDEEGDEAMVHNALFLINIGLCVAFILLPNVLLSMAFTPGWPCRCRDDDDPSERSVYYSRKHPPIDGDL
uniref:TSP1_CCN domain-containing protein n=1 Tax=Ascaris lumbricoides TaxID=6252 RepID=A0A0M3I931_ASCLU